MTYRHLAPTLVLCLCALPVAAQDLLTILDQAIRSDPRVRISELQMEVAESQDAQAFGRLLPSVNVGAQVSEIDRKDVEAQPNFLGVRNQFDNFTGERYSISARQTLYNREALKNRTRTKNLVRQSAYEVEEALASLMIDVGRKYLTVLGNQDNLALVRAEKDSVVKRLEQYQELYDKRMIRITDLLEAQVRRDQILADEIEVESNVLVSKEELRALTGGDIGDLVPLADSAAFPALQGTMDFWVEQSHAYSPVLLARQKAIDAARAGYAQAKGARWPTLDLQLSLLDSDTGFENAAAPRTETSSVALVFNLPILNGGINVARANEARSQLELERMRHEEALRELIRAVKEAYVTAQANDKRMEAARAQVESAAKAHEAMEQSFQFGTVTVIDVIEALQRKFEASRDLLSAKYSYLIAWLQLRYYAGELDRQEILTVNAMLEH